MRPLLRWLALLGFATLALQLFFVLRIGAMTVFNPQSTAFERSEAWRLANEKGNLRWRQQWRAYPDMSNHLKRAVIASEDDGFVGHEGIDWNALEKAWKKNARVEAQMSRKASSDSAKGKPAATRAPKVVGGSTITQQLAKNLFLSGERTLLRKGQEMLLTLALEALLSKQRILEIYLNSVEWGEGLFGAEAAARHYFHVPAQSLGTVQAARLAVMLPAPKRFEKRPNSAYVIGRAGTIAARMGAVDPP